MKCAVMLGDGQPCFSYTQCEGRACYDYLCATSDRIEQEANDPVYVFYSLWSALMMFFCCVVAFSLFKRRRGREETVDRVESRTEEQERLRRQQLDRLRRQQAQMGTPMYTVDGQVSTCIDMRTQKHTYTRTSPHFR